MAHIKCGGDVVFEQNLATVEVFQRLKGKMTRLLELALQDERLTPLQGYVLMLLAQEETMTISALSERAQMGQANTSTLCKKLERSGYLTRTRGEQDERIVTLALTGDGRKALDRTGARLARYSALLERLPASVKEDIRRGVEAADYALDYLQDQIKGEQDQC